MKVVQSFWSKPAVDNGMNYDFHRFKGGFFSHQHHLMSWALSCLQFRKYYSQVELITDSVGKELLIDQLGLPYTKVSTALDNLENYDADLWALGKIYAYGMQNEPFLHADGDIFPWERLDPYIEKAALVSLHREDTADYYSFLEEFKKSFTQIPELLQKDMKEERLTYVGNAGIIGGYNYQFFQSFCKQVMAFVSKQSSDRDKRHGLFNAIIEQYFFTCLAAKEEIPIKYILESDDLDYIEMTQFNGRLTHFAGPNKGLAFKCEQLSKMLEIHYPEYYGRIMEIGSAGFINKGTHVVAEGTTKNNLSEGTQMLKEVFPKTIGSLMYMDGKSAEGFLNSAHQFHPDELIQEFSFLVEAVAKEQGGLEGKQLSEVFDYEVIKSGIRNKTQQTKQRKEELGSYGSSLLMIRMSDADFMNLSFKMKKDSKLMLLSRDWASLPHETALEESKGDSHPHKILLKPSAELGVLEIPVNETAMILERFTEAKAVHQALSELRSIVDVTPEEHLESVMKALNIKTKESLISILPRVVIGQVKEFLGSGIIEEVTAQELAKVQPSTVL